MSCSHILAINLMRHLYVLYSNPETKYRLPGWSIPHASPVEMGFNVSLLSDFAVAIYDFPPLLSISLLFLSFLFLSYYFHPPFLLVFIFSFLYSHCTGVFLRFVFFVCFPLSLSCVLYFFNNCLFFLQALSSKLRLPCITAASYNGIDIELREIRGSHGGLFEDGCLLGCCVLKSARSLPTFQKCFLPP
jgi:hypothetical protein